MNLQHRTYSFRRLLVSSLAILTLGAVSEVGHAFPGRGANCAMCHTDTGGGNVEASPNSLTLLPGESGTVTFDVSNLPGDAALSLTGFDAAGLEVTADPDWTARDDDTRFTLSGIATAGQQTFDVTIGPGATPGDYSIGVFLAGGGSEPTGLWSTMGDFTLSVAIPEPATAVLLSILMGVAAMAFSIRRRNKFAEQRG